MKYPKINKQPRREVNVPQLSGGLNLRDSLTGVRDNQMTDCVNMWYKDGMLRTRPPARNYNGGIGDIYDVEKTKVFYDVTKDDAVLVSYCKKMLANGVGIDFYWQSKTELTAAGGFVEYSVLGEETGYFVIEKDDSLYCYTVNGNIYRCYCFTENTVWEAVSQDEIYIPTAVIHCQRTGVYEMFGGTQFEGYNLLTDKYKMIYSAYNENDSDATHPMRYAIVHPLPDGYIGDVIAEITTYNGTSEDDISTTKHIVHIDGSSDTYEYYEEKGDTVPADGLQFYVKKNYVGFLNWDIEGYQTAICIDTDERKKKYACMEDNLTLILPYEVDSNARKKVFCMTQSIWFGGSANGINNGSRLFLCGNTVDEEKSLVLWSSLNNPLYFSENNYAYVGNKAQPVTAFGRQGENLIIFKPDETYYSYYAQNTDITADDLINQTVIDYEGSSVYFPIVTLHSSVGCECPDTVQLCRNRLVWLNSDGKVYTLVSANQYSEMTVYPVSDMIERKLRENYSKEMLTSATSHDFEGYYVLMIGTDAYVMDYNSYGYTHIYGYSKTEDANCLIPWYYWKFSVEDENIKFYGYRDFLFSFYIKSNGLLTFCVLYDGDSDLNFYDEKFVSAYQSKLFDFSAAGYLKNVDRVSVSFGNNCGVPINVSFITDMGSESNTVVLGGDSTDERDAAFVRCKNFYPTAKAVRTFGVKIECNGKLAVDGISLQYRLLGGVK